MATLDSTEVERRRVRLDGNRPRTHPSTKPRRKAPHLATTPAPEPAPKPRPNFDEIMTRLGEARAAFTCVARCLDELADSHDARKHRPATCSMSRHACGRGSRCWPWQRRLIWRSPL
jgi:hypothetical protein